MLFFYIMIFTHILLVFSYTLLFKSGLCPLVDLLFSNLPPGEHLEIPVPRLYFRNQLNYTFGSKEQAPVFLKAFFHTQLILRAIAVKCSFNVI